MKEKIWAEAERLFWQHGVRSVTMEDIARQLGISKKTIYQHFDDKEDILCQIMQSKVDADVAELNCIADVTLNPIEEMMGMLQMICKKQEHVNPCLFTDVQRYYSRAYQLIRQHVDNHIMKQVVNNILRGKRDGIYRDDINPRVMARIRVEQIELALSTDFTSFDEGSRLDIQRDLTHHFVRGMLTEKGFAIYNEYKND
ncbi:TetR/AcrR family transcriptional regulator [Spirosoma sp. KUDC1026]|uniref:TetR/AcrR family transcriptional regulator n=1 Tax=Spirosoma sp. KUDC1026 TaxID=2745947 RepID=UPI00159BCC30|nr:TetR/AcrR family transcriptional regulator [Spirosoma sp. KUDC1026]QKZ11687.1 TetR/AcrR family transcriptional regulator [Spirosoma sp. KUDC1026]